MAQDESFLGAVYSVIEDSGELWLSESAASAWLSGERSPSIWLSGESTPSGDMVKNPERPQFPYEFPYEWNLATESTFISSPVESVASSHETESEEDDYIADLAERIAHSMLDDDDSTEQKGHSKNWSAEERSPWAPDAGKGLSRQFTLPGSESWSTRSWSSNSVTSSNGSSQVSSQVSSPPSTPLGADNEAWELLYAAAGEVAGMRTSEEMNASATCYSQLGVRQQPGSGVANQRQQAIWGENELLTMPSTHMLPSGRGSEFHAKVNSFPALPSLYGDKKVSSAQFFQRSAGTKEEDGKVVGTQPRLPKQATVSPWGRQSRPPIQQQSSGCNNRGYKSGGSGQRVSWTADVSSCQWPPLQPAAAGSGLRAVFLGSNLPGRESAGTGVFLPRRIGSGTDTKRKPACSTVLLPSRIVQALNLNVEDVRSPLMRQNAIYTQPATAGRRDLSSSPSPAPTYSSGQHTGRENRANPNPIWKSVYPTCSPLQQVAADIALPTEWTY